MLWNLPKLPPPIDKDSRQLDEPRDSRRLTSQEDYVWCPRNSYGVPGTPPLRMVSPELPYGVPGTPPRQIKIGVIASERLLATPSPATRPWPPRPSRRWPSHLGGPRIGPATSSLGWSRPAGRGPSCRSSSTSGVGPCLARRIPFLGSTGGTGAVWTLIVAVPTRESDRASMRKLPSSSAENRPSWSIVPPVADQVTIGLRKGCRAGRGRRPRT